MFLTLISFLLLPKKQFVKKESLIETGIPDVDSLDEREINQVNNNQYDVIEDAHIIEKEAIDYKNDIEDTNGNTTEIKRDERISNVEKYSARHLIFTKEYILLVLWFSLLLIPQQYYIATIGLQLERKNDITGKYTKLFAIIYASVAILGPIFGKIADLFGTLNITIFVT